MDEVHRIAVIVPELVGGVQPLTQNTFDLVSLPMEPGVWMVSFTW